MPFQEPYIYYLEDSVDQQLKMEVEQQPSAPGPLLPYLAHTTHTSLISTTLDFLDIDDLEILTRVAFAHTINSQLFKAAIIRALSKKYLNKVDRSVFFLFYQDEDFLSLEKNTINILANQPYPFLYQTYRGYQHIFQALPTHTSYLQTQADFQSLLEQLFLEPDLPMPKFKRETIGMHCQSGFQQHLCLIKFPPEEVEELWVEEPIEELKNILGEQLLELTQSLHFSQESSQEVIKKVTDIRFCGWRVTYDNWSSFLLQKFKTHNLIVLMFGLCSQMVVTFRKVIEVIKDPFMKFTEFALRANIYRNIVLAIEEKFAFIFQNYDQFYRNCFHLDDKYPCMNFWRPALSIWVQQMQKFHSSNAKAYNYIVSRLRQNNLKQFLAIKTQKLPSFFSQLKRQMDLEAYSTKRKEQFYSQTESKIQMEGYFENNFEMYQTLAKDYIQYMVDISMNEFNVHLCGHSQHSILHFKLFGKFLENIVTETADLYWFIREVIDRSVPKEIRLNIFKQVAKEDLICSDQRLFKPCIVKEIIEMVNSWIKQEVIQMSEFAIFDEEGYSKNKISFDFQEKDGMLTYFSNKYNITPDCPVDLSFFYNIQLEDTDPSFPKEKDDDEQNLQNIEQYISDEEEDQQQLGGDGKMEPEN